MAIITSIAYNDSTLATITEGQSITLHTNGKKMIANIIIDGNAKIICGNKLATVVSSGQPVILNCSGKTLSNNIEIVGIAEGENVEGTEGLSYILSDDGTRYFCNGIGTSTDKSIIIANEINGIPVTKISSGALYGCNSLTSVYIPNNITFIDITAFKNCTNLTSVTVGNSVSTISDGAFQYCTSLKSVKIPNSVVNIGEGTFSGCTNLAVVSIGDGVATIENSAFYGCTSLTDINVSENNTAYKSIDGNLYSKDGKALNQYAIGKKDTTFTIPDGVNDINGYAFNYCANLTNIIIPDSVDFISEMSLRSCANLIDITVSENNNFYKSIDGNLYTKDSETLMQYAIGKDDQNFVIPNGVTRIGENAFEGCVNLVSIEIPQSVSYIGVFSFSNCPNILDVYYDGTKAQWDAIEINSGNPPFANAKIHFKEVDTNFILSDGSTLVTNDGLIFNTIT